MNLVDGIFSIEQGSGLFERTVLGLNDDCRNRISKTEPIEERERGRTEVEIHPLKGKESNINNVILPSELAKSDRVDILIEDEGERDRKVEDRETLGAELIRENLDSIGDDKRRKGDIIRSVEQENPRNDSTTSSGTLLLGIQSRTDGLKDEEQQHSSRRSQEEYPPPDLVNKERSADSPEEIPNLEDTVDEELGEGVFDTDGFENLVEVVRNQPVSGPLREEGETDDDPHTTTVSRSSEERLPSNGVLDRTIHLDSGLDLLILVLDKRILVIPIGMVISQNLERLLVPLLMNQPTWGFRAEVDEEDLEDGREGLEDGRETPRPVALHAESTESRPGGNDGTRVPERVVCRGQGSAVGGVGNLGNQHGGGHGSEGETETNEET